MPLIKNGQIIEDSWRVIEDGDTLPDDGDTIVTLERLEAEANHIKARRGRTGVILDNTVDPQVIAKHLPHLGLVALQFPAFTDGRAYSQARELRAHLGFAGELRATGAVLADQTGFLSRVGFDTFEAPGNVPLDVWNRASRSMTVAYQRGYDGELATRDDVSAAPSRNHKTGTNGPRSQAALA